MHEEILTKEQIELLPLLKLFSKDFGLVGGTAIALHLGHRNSIDFDLFTGKEFDSFKIREKISKFKKIDKVIRNETGEYTLIINQVRFTFFHYPFAINFFKSFSDIIKLPDLLTLAAMKAYTLGRRAKWKDYVDIYFISERYYGLEKIIKKSKKIFSNEFNEKLFRIQLAYFEDIDFSEKVSYQKGFELNDEIIKKKLIDFSLNK